MPTLGSCLTRQYYYTGLERLDMEILAYWAGFGPIQNLIRIKLCLLLPIIVCYKNLNIVILSWIVAKLKSIAFLGSFTCSSKTVQILNRDIKWQHFLLNMYKSFKRQNFLSSQQFYTELHIVELLWQLKVLPFKGHLHVPTKMFRFWIAMKNWSIFC